MLTHPRRFFGILYLEPKFPPPPPTPKSLPPPSLPKFPLQTLEPTFNRLALACSLSVALALAARSVTLALALNCSRPQSLSPSLAQLLVRHCYCLPFIMISLFVCIIVLHYRSVYNFMLERMALVNLFLKGNCKKMFSLVPK